jgi:hypothetical protein
MTFAAVIFRGEPGALGLSFTDRTDQNTHLPELPRSFESASTPAPRSALLNAGNTSVSKSEEGHCQRDRVKTRQARSVAVSKRKVWTTTTHDYPKPRLTEYRFATHLRWRPFPKIDPDKQNASNYHSIDAICKHALISILHQHRTHVLYNCGVSSTSCGSRTRRPTTQGPRYLGLLPYRCPSLIRALVGNPCIFMERWDNLKPISHLGGSARTKCTPNFDQSSFRRHS